MKSFQVNLIDSVPVAKHIYVLFLHILEPFDDA